MSKIVLISRFIVLLVVVDVADVLVFYFFIFCLI